MQQKSRRYYFMILSYCISIAFPLALSILLYPVLMDSFSQNAFSQNISMLSVLAQEQDSYMERIDYAMEYLQTHPDIVELSRQEQYRLGQTEYNEYQAFLDLNKAGTNLTVKDILVYYPSTERIISRNGAMDFDLYYKLYLTSSEFTKETAQSYLSAYHAKEFRKIDGDTLLYLSSDLHSMGMNPVFQICFLLDKSTLQDSLAQAQWNKGISLVQMDRKGNAITGIGDPISVPLPHDSHQFQGTALQASQTTMGRGKNKKILLHLTSTYWDYYEMIPNAIYAKDVTRIQILFFAGMALCFIMVVFLANFFTRKNYLPIRRTMNVLGGTDGQPIADEYQWIEQKAKQIFGEKELALKQIKDKSESVRRFALTQLLDRCYEADGKMPGIIDFRGDFFLVTVVNYYDDCAKKQLQNIGYKEISFYEMLLTKLFDASPLIDVDYYFIMAHAKSIILFNAVASIASEVVSLMEETNEKLEEEYALQTSILIGGEHRGKEGIHGSYREALDLLPYTYLLDSNVLWYDDLKDRQCSTHLGMEQEQKIINAISTGNGEEAKRIVGGILNGLKGATPYTYRYSLFTILDYLAKAAEKNGVRNAFERMEETRSLSIEATLDENERKFGRCIDCLGQWIRERRDREGNTFIDTVNRYVQDNYTDPNINISSIAFHFEITPSYLSTLYRNATGQSLLHRINHLRVEAALPLLETHRSIAQIATELGFHDSNAFIRVFKKLKGTTPGQMRALQQGSR